MAEMRLAKTGRELRGEVEQLMRDDLIGPVGGPEEELLEPPVDTYLLGMLAPRFGFNTAPPDADDAESGQDGPIEADAQPDDDLATDVVSSDSGAEGTPEERPPA